jgi:hypothetical protein
MKVWISDSESVVVTCLKLEPCSEGNLDIVCLEGDLPSGLTVQDLGQLGIVTYEPDNRGRPIPKVWPIEPSENLDYLRALIEAMPPGYFVSKVESEKIDQLRQEKADKFQRELEKIEAEEP